MVTVETNIDGGLGRMLVFVSSVGNHHSLMQLARTVDRLGKRREGIEFERRVKLSLVLASKGSHLVTG